MELIAKLKIFMGAIASAAEFSNKPYTVKFSLKERIFHIISPKPKVGQQCKIFSRSSVANFGRWSRSLATVFLRYTPNYLSPTSSNTKIQPWERIEGVQMVKLLASQRKWTNSQNIPLWPSTFFKGMGLNPGLVHPLSVSLGWESKPRTERKRKKKSDMPTLKNSNPESCLANHKHVETIWKHKIILLKFSGISLYLFEEYIPIKQ